MSWHITGFCPAHVEDVEALEDLWAAFVQSVAELPNGEKFTGLIAGGDWVGEDHLPANSFHLTADQARQGQRWRR